LVTGEYPFDAAVRDQPDERHQHEDPERPRASRYGPVPLAAVTAYLRALADAGLIAASGN
jgi:hypothetical protein